jgi:Na+/H+-dicarboxylate symporter
MVFGFIFRALIKNQHNSLFLILAIFGGVTLSNSVALITAYFFGSTFLPLLGLDSSPDLIEKFNSPISPLFKIELPKLIGTEIAMASGLTLGVLISFLKEGHTLKGLSAKVCDKLNRVISLFLKKVFMPFLPFYVFGFCLKLSFDHALVHLFQEFGKVFALGLVLVMAYLFILYVIGAGGDVKQALSHIRSMLPACLTGFSTMSSAATLPVSVNCTEKVTGDRDFAELIIPSTSNIHMLGDDLNIMLYSMTLLSTFGMAWPDGVSIIPFAIAFSLAKLSCVGVPGASVLVILPVLQNYLGFTPEMISVMTTLYVLQDSFGTSANVMGNGAFALIIQRIFCKRSQPVMAADITPSLYHENSL